MLTIRHHHHDWIQVRLEDDGNFRRLRFVNILVNRPILVHMDAVRTIWSNEKDTFLLFLHPYVLFAFEWLRACPHFSRLFGRCVVFGFSRRYSVFCLIDPRHAATHPWQTYKVPLLRTCFLPSNNFSTLILPKFASFRSMIFRRRTQNVMWFFTCLSFFCQKLQGIPPCGNDEWRRCNLESCYIDERELYTVLSWSSVSLLYTLPSCTKIKRHGATADGRCPPQKSIIREDHVWDVTRKCTTNISCWSSPQKLDVQLLWPAGRSAGRI